MKGLEKLLGSGGRRGGGFGSASVVQQFFIQEALSLCLESGETMFDPGEVPGEKAALDEEF